jgi:predicted MFS family arabinose efflux permease
MINLNNPLVLAAYILANGIAIVFGCWVGNRFSRWYDKRQFIKFMTRLYKGKKKL